MNRQTAVLALLLLGGCSHSTSQPAAYPTASRSTTTAPVPTAQSQPAPRAQTPAPAASQTHAQTPAPAASQTQAQAQAQVNAPPAYGGPTTPDTTAAPRQGEVVQAYPTTGGAMQSPSATPMPQSATGPSAQPAPTMPIPNLSACEGLSNDEIMRPVFGDATATQALTRLEGKQRATVSNGVAVRLPAQPGHNQAYMQRLVNCQTAQARASSTSAVESPLAVEGTRSRVVSSHGAYEVRLTNPDPERAREVQRRTEAVTPPTATVMTPSRPASTR